MRKLTHAGGAIVPPDDTSVTQATTYVSRYEQPVLVPQSRHV